MPAATLYISRDPNYDWLSALPFGRVDDGQPERCWLGVSEQFAFWRPPRGRGPRGFFVNEFSSFDPEDPEVAEIWRGPRFDAPLLGLREASAGEIAVAAGAQLGERPTLNRLYFEAATRLHGRRALGMWRMCLESGDAMAHFALGYTLHDLGRHHEAYRHLRHYVELAPANAWNWCWLGRGAAAIGEEAEARSAYARAIALSRRGDDETDAPELLAELDRDARAAR